MPFLLPFLHHLLLQTHFLQWVVDHKNIGENSVLSRVLAKNNIPPDLFKMAMEAAEKEKKTQAAEVQSSGKELESTEAKLKAATANLKDDQVKATEAKFNHMSPGAQIQPRVQPSMDEYRIRKQYPRNNVNRSSVHSPI